MVGQHDAAGTHADRARGRRHMAHHHGGGCAGNSAHAMVLGQPIALVAPGLGVLRQVACVAKSIGRGAAFGNRCQVQNGKGNHVFAL